MIKKELYLVKENPNLKDTYTREYLLYFNQEDKEFIKKVRDLDYKFLLIKTEVEVENMYNPPEPKLFVEISQDIINPEDLLDDRIQINIEPGVKND